MQRTWRSTLALAAGTAFLAACGGNGSDGKAGAGQGEAAPAAGSGSGLALTGAGATFPAPVYSKWFDAYGQAHGLKVNYQSIGSGGGIQQVTQGTVDFGASDAPMNAEEQGKAPGVMHLPTVMGSVAVTYNLPGLAQPLKLSGPTLARLFLGTVTRWNDPAIAAENPGVPLPATNVVVAHRSDGSGTTFVFTDYLAQVSPEWKAKVGNGKSVNWPGGLGAKGNEGVAGAVKQTPGSIGYVELAYALQNGLSMAALKNAAGQFVSPSVESTAAAAEAVAGRVANGDFKVSLVNAAGAGAYPIATWTYLLVPAHWQDCGKANAFAGLVTWALTQGGDMAKDLHYAPLPEAVRPGVLAQLGKVTCGSGNEPVKPAA
jgi:phosphate transport system substrate-binding protein